jgi:hypothetical protein
MSAVKNVWDTRVGIKNLKSESGIWFPYKKIFNTKNLTNEIFPPQIAGGI